MTGSSPVKYALSMQVVTEEYTREEKGGLVRTRGHGTIRVPYIHTHTHCTILRVRGSAHDLGQKRGPFSLGRWHLPEPSEAARARVCCKVGATQRTANAFFGHDRADWRINAYDVYARAPYYPSPTLCSACSGRSDSPGPTPPTQGRTSDAVIPRGHMLTNLSQGQKRTKDHRQWRARGLG